MTGKNCVERELVIDTRGCISHASTIDTSASEKNLRELALAFSLQVLNRHLTQPFEAL
jgi:hypothetical protein